MKHNFDEIIERKATNSTKFEAGNSVYKDLADDHLPMWVADMDFASPKPILDALKARIDCRILGYSNFYDENYYTAVINWMDRHFGYKVLKEEIVFSPGVVPAVANLITIMTEQSDSVLIHTPAYYPFEACIKKSNRTPIHSSLICTDGYYTINFEEFEEICARPEVTLYILCSPHNPTGRVFSEEELLKIYNICKKNNVAIISDEIHMDLTRNGVIHTPLSKLFPDDCGIVTCTAPSKTFNLAGMSLSNIIIKDPELKEKFAAASGGHPSPLAIEALIAAYTKCDDWLADLCSYLDENFKILKEELESKLPGAHLEISEGTYLAWVDLRGLNIPHDEMIKRVVSGGVFPDGGEMFLADGEGFIRLNLACPASVVKEAVDRLSKALS